MSRCGVGQALVTSRASLCRDTDVIGSSSGRRQPLPFWFRPPPVPRRAHQGHRRRELDEPDTRKTGRQPAAPAERARQSRLPPLFLPRSPTPGRGPKAPDLAPHRERAEAPSRPADAAESSAGRAHGPGVRRGSPPVSDHHEEQCDDHRADNQHRRRHTRPVGHSAVPSRSSMPITSVDAADGSALHRVSAGGFRWRKPEPVTV